MAKARAPKVLRRTRVDGDWRIADAGDQEPWRPARSNRRGTTGLTVPDNGEPSPPVCTAHAEEHPASADRRAVAVTDHGRTFQSQLGVHVT